MRMQLGRYCRRRVDIAPCMWLYACFDADGLLHFEKKEKRTHTGQSFVVAVAIVR